jgi:hypothetical protein
LTWWEPLLRILYRDIATKYQQRTLAVFLTAQLTVFCGFEDPPSAVNNVVADSTFVPKSWLAGDFKKLQLILTVKIGANRIA